MARFLFDFDFWCKEAIRKINYRPDRQAVYSVLHQHLQDRYQGFIDQNMEHEEAVQKALQAMGDAKELPLIDNTELYTTYSNKYNVYTDAEYEDDYSKWERILYQEQGTQKSSDGLMFSIERVALWQETLKNPDDAHLGWWNEHRLVADIRLYDSNDMLLYEESLIILPAFVETMIEHGVPLR